jgi:hypothetical protein
MACKTYVTLLLGILMASSVTGTESKEGIRYVEPGIFRDQTYLEVHDHAIRFVNGHSGFYVPGRDELVHEICLNPYKVESSSGLPFVVDETAGQRVLLLRNTELAHLVFETTAGPNGPRRITSVFSGISEDLYESLNGFSLYFTEVQVSSYLRQRNTTYGVENLTQNGLQEPWVEGVEGHGIGEYIEFDLGSEAEPEVGRFNGLYVYNGFISYDRPHLYRQNSRVRRFLVQDLTEGDKWTVELEDTPHPQIIELTGREWHRIRLVIDDVYPGTKYEDTCIAAVSLRGYYPD